MAGLPSWRVVTRAAMLMALVALAVAVEMAPLGLDAAARPSPDLVLCLVVAMRLRRPEAAPLLLVWLLGLGRDLLTDLPVGGGALALMAAAALAGHWRGWLGRRAFPAEWAALAALALGTTALQWVLVLVTFSQPPALMQAGEQALLTTFAYPAVVVLLRWILGVSWGRLDPAEGRMR